MRGLLIIALFVALMAIWAWNDNSKPSPDDPDIQMMDSTP